METWNSYFGSSKNVKSYSKKKYSFPSYEENQILIDQNIFENLDFGAFVFSRNDINITHNECIFENCSRPDTGGAIYFKCQSNFIQRRSLFISCISAKSCQFFHISLLSSNKHFAYMLDSSLINSNNPENADLMTFANGIFGITCTNISRNSNKKASGLVVLNGISTPNIN